MQNLNVAVLSEFLALLDRHRVCFKIRTAFFADVQCTGKFAAPRCLRANANRALREGGEAFCATDAADVFEFGGGRIKKDKNNKDKKHNNQKDGWPFHTKEKDPFEYKGLLND